MIKLNEKLIDALAAEYVLGTQSALVRRRMQSLMQEHPQLADRVEQWQNRLNQMSEQARPVPAPPWVWRKIENTLQPPAKEKSGWWQNLLVWRWAAATAMATALLLAVYPATEQSPVLQPAEGGFVMVLTDEDSKTAWLVSRQNQDKPIKAEAITVPVMTVAQAYELWLLPPDGAAPMSLGLLNEQGGTQLTPASMINQMVQPGYMMAVSIEPPGGSPTGAPTGPVVYTGSILKL